VANFGFFANSTIQHNPFIRLVKEGICLASFPNRPRRRRRRLFFVWLVQANLSPIAFSIQTFSHPGKPPHPQPTARTIRK
jgi:hypothetical protein